MAIGIRASSVIAADKVVIIPLYSHKISVTCNGTLNGTRWCDNGNGTVTDMTTGLVWLRKGNCIGSKKWIDHPDGTAPEYDDALTATSRLKGPEPSCGFNDGSKSGDWRLPTKTELMGLC